MDYIEALNLHKQLHEQDSNIFAGYSLAAHMPEIANFIKLTNIKTVLDYGCGKALGWRRGNYHHMLGLDKRNIYLYDPCVKEFNIAPHSADLVVCIDVMEHIPESSVDDVLKEIFSISKKAVYFSISHRPANKLLPNGVNAHLTVKPEEWWADKIKQHSDYKIVKGLRFE